MIVASHDRYLVERVTDVVYGMFGDGRLVHLPGGIDEYLARTAGGPLSAGVATAAGSAPAERRPGMSAAEERAARKELGKLERQLTRLDSREKQLNDSLAAHGSDYDKIVEFEAELKTVQAERAQVEETWLELAEQLPAD
jgi:hypothetical protein